MEEEEEPGPKKNKFQKISIFLMSMRRSDSDVTLSSDAVSEPRFGRSHKYSFLEEGLFHRFHRVEGDTVKLGIPVDSHVILNLCGKLTIANP